MLEEILHEIDEMGYPSAGIGCGLEDAGITDRYEVAAYGFTEARERIVEIIRSHSNDEWIPCSERLPEEPGDGLRDMDELEEYVVTIQGADISTTLKYAGDGEWYDPITDGFYSVVAWQPLPSTYCPKAEIHGRGLQAESHG